MEILFDAQLPTAAEPPAFSLTFEPEHMALQCIADMAAIRVQAQMKRESAFWNRPQFRDLYPLLFPLYGILYGSSSFPGNQGIAASLVPMENFPLAFPDENSQLLNLSFHCSRAYLQYIEEQRASNPRAPLTLGVSFWTAMSLFPTAPTTSGNTPSARSPHQGKLLYVKNRQGGSSGSISISQSHWSDMLSSIGYPQRRYIELPTLAPQEGAEELHRAIEHVNIAHTLFAQGNYREAVQRCRQARDALLGEHMPTWAATYLAPILGAEKSAMVDESIRALNHMGNVASHGRNLEIEIDREVANYVIGSLTLILDYVGRKLR